MAHKTTLFLLFLLALPFSARAATLECQQLPQLFQVYFRSHYSIKSMTPEVKTHTIDQFIKHMDPSNTLLLQADVTKLKKDLLTVFDTMQSGNCTVLTDTSELLIKRAEEDEQFVKDYLSKEYKLDESVELVLDPDKRGYTKTSQERQDLVKKMVNFEVSNYLSTKMKMDEAKKQLIHRYGLITKRLKERETKAELPELYAESFATALDPHTNFMSQETLEDFQIQMRLSLEGIGASLSSQDGFTVIEDLIPGGSAERTKLLRPKDKIIAVAQKGEKPVPVIDMDLRDVVKMIRGKKGTKVTLTVLRQADKSKTFDVTIVRDKIDIKDQAAKITYQTRKIGNHNYNVGVLDLPSFYGSSEKGGRSSYEDVKRLLLEAKGKNVDAIVLDLSRNGGGLLQDAVRISGLFIKRGAVVATKDAEKHVEVLSDDDDEVVYSGPLVVLTSHLSASASEILAGALKDYHRALIVGGDHTFGKGTVQVLSDLGGNLGAIKVTTGMFFTPGGASTQHVGVTSDVQIPSIFNNDDVGEKTMDYSLPPQSISSFLSSDANTPEPGKHWSALDEKLVLDLAKRSQERVAKEPKFVAIRQEIADAQKNKAIVRLADLRADQKKKPTKPEDKRGWDQKMKDLEGPFVDEGVNIAVDLAMTSPSGGQLTKGPF